MCNFDRRIGRSEQAQVLVQAMTLALEDRIAGPVTDHVQRFCSGRHGRGAPDQPGFLIAQVERFARQVSDRVVAPGGQAVFAAVLCPGAAGTSFGDHEAELRVGDDVDPWMRRMLTRLEMDDVFPPSRLKPPRPLSIIKSPGRGRGGVGSGSRAGEMDGVNIRQAGGLGG